MHAPGFDPLYRAGVIVFPADHPAYGWECGVPSCERPRTWIAGAGLCQAHYRDWCTARRGGMSKAAFLSGAIPLQGKRRFLTACRICPGRPTATRTSDLCRRHHDAWARHRDTRDFDAWLAEQVAYDGYGTCQVVVCAALADGPLGLCTGHRERYRDDGRPGGARLPANWLHRLESRGLPVPVDHADEAAFRAWCTTTRTVRHLGEISLLGLQPLIKAEIAWGLHTHAGKKHRSHWSPGWIRALVHLVRRSAYGSLADVDLSTCSDTDRMIVGEILDDLRLVYFSPQDTRDAGFIEAEHFGRRFPHARSHIDLSDVSLRWLRDLLWDHLADLLNSPRCPRTRKVFDGLRRACAELSAFLAVDAPAGGQDPTLLGAEHVARFVADQRRREREGLPSLTVSRKDGQPSPVTVHTRREVFNYARRLLHEALRTGRAERIGLPAAFITAMPTGGATARISRNPFTDEVAKALTDETNLTELDHLDVHDRGTRDIWETIVLTGRRCNEVLKLRLDCIGHYNGLPMLWHDQTKVGNYNAGRLTRSEKSAAVRPGNSGPRRPTSPPRPARMVGVCTAGA